MKRILFSVLTVLLLAAAAFGVRAAVLRQRQIQEELQHQAELDRVTEYTGVLDAVGIEQLEQYRNLRRLELSGSADVPAILAYRERHPEVELRYTVDLGGTTVDNQTESLHLREGAYDVDLLHGRLAWLPALRELHLDSLNCPPEDIEALRLAYPAISISYSVSLRGEQIPEDAQTLDWTELEARDVEQALAALALLPDLERVELTDAEGNNRLGLENLQKLQQARPEVLFSYRFFLFGQEISTEMEEVSYVRAEIGNEGLPQLREALPCLTRCRRFVLDNCGIDYEELARLREEFPQTKIVWSVYITYLNFLTDVKIIHLTFALTNSNAQVMRFCNEVEYLDIGHNSISDISFMAYMPHLKYVILSYNNVSDLSPLANCHELEMLELYQCLKLKDISPLAACESLKLLNVSWTEIQDIRPVFGLKNLERFYCIWNYGIPEEQMEQIFEELPDCWITFEQEVSKNVGWSFDAIGGVRAQWYLDMYKILRYRVEHYFFGDYPEGWNQEEN